MVRSAEDHQVSSRYSGKLSLRLSLLLIGFILMMILRPSSADAHTKGVSLSRYGLVDVSWTANIVYGNFSNYEEGANPI